MSNAEENDNLRPFSQLCLGAKFKYNSSNDRNVYVKISPDTIALWDPNNIDTNWLGQPVCAFSDGGDLDSLVKVVEQI